jgi:hypothetical protein
MSEPGRSVPLMAYAFQVTLDCSDPHAQADWWAETLGWEVEPQDESFILRMVEEGHATEEDTTRHRGALVWRTGAALRGPEPGMPRLYLQAVPEPKSVKNRMHLDVRLGPGADLEAAVVALVARGATRLYAQHQGPHAWVTMADPEGNEFCVSP